MPREVVSQAPKSTGAPRTEGDRWSVAVRWMADDPATVPARHYGELWRRHRWRVLLAVALAAGTGGLVAARWPQRYEATAILDLDRQFAARLGREPGAALGADSEQFLATQARLLQSDAVLRPVAERHGLLALERPGERIDPGAPVELKRLRIRRPPNTTLVEISYRAPAPRLAAQVANEIAFSYLGHRTKLHLEAARAQARFLEAQLAELAAKLKTNSEALARLERELNVVSAQENGNMAQARLQQLNQELMAAQAARLRAEAARQSVASGSMEAAQNAASGESLRRLAERANELRERFAELRTLYGPNHPEYRKAVVRVEELERQMSLVRQSVAARVEAEFREAAAREQLLAQTLEAAKREFDRQHAQRFDYEALQQTVAADRRLYEDLTRKLREAALLAQLEGATARIVAAARPPARPAGPPPALVAVLAGAAALAFSVALILAADALNCAVRDAAEVERLLGAPVVGSLPDVSCWRKGECPVAGALDESDRAVAAFAEALRRLRNAIRLNGAQRTLRSVLVTSAAAREGKSTVAAHWAALHAAQGRRTLLVEADLRQSPAPAPGRALLGGGAHRDGLAEVIAHGRDWRAELWTPHGCPGLSVLSAGRAPVTPGDCAARGLAAVLARAVEEFELVVVDAPPLLGFPEPMEMAALVDGVLVVSQAGVTPRAQLRTVFATLAQVGAQPVGIVLNRTPASGRWRRQNRGAGHEAHWPARVAASTSARS